VNDLDGLALSLVTGVVSGLVATLFVFVVRTYWLKIIMPWYENVLYQGPKIEGVWITEVHFPDEMVNTHRITLKRAGYKIIGTAVCVEGEIEGESHEITGTFNNRLLTCYYHASGDRRLERGAFTLMLVDNGKKLKGHLAYYENRQDTVLSVPMEMLPEKP
jgi:hypothetical protein